MESVWSKQTKIAKRESLKGDIQVQTAVIGAGMAGILTAYLLKKEGMDVVVVEAKKIASGQTQNTTAKITSQHGMIYDRMIREIGRERAAEYAMANEDAIKIFERIIKEEKINCRFEKLPAYLYTWDEAKAEKMEREAIAARELGIKAHFVKEEAFAELPFEAKYGVCFENQAQFHPLAFVKRLAEQLVVYENTNVLWVKKHVIATDKGKITAENIVFATHYPFINVPGFYFLRQHQERSYVLALGKKKEEMPKAEVGLQGMYYGIDKGGLSLRSKGDLLLLGGGAHRTGKKESEEEGFTYLREMAKKYYPDRIVKTQWAAQDCMPCDEIPFIGKYSVLRQYWYVATGFHKWGMTSSMVAAQIISDKICKKENMYEKVFCPQRLYLRASFRNLLIDMGESIAGLTKGWFGKKGHRCSHMGCRVEWNAEEKSWDCPCHGSRFDQDGKLIDNPAQASKG